MRDLSAAEIDVLVALHETKRPTSADELTHACGLEHADGARLIAYLIGSGLVVEWRPHRGRARLLVLTPQGRAHAEAERVATRTLPGVGPRLRRSPLSDE